jgi:phosphatidylglycerophosphate synthase
VGTNKKMALKKREEKPEINQDDISGRKRKLDSFLSPLEINLTSKVLPFIPDFVKSYHLTLATIPLIFLMIVSSFLAKKNLFWLLGNSLLVLIQYLTDHFDGNLGRYRNEGLVRWGFYADHFLDFIFAASIIVGYIIVFPKDQLSLLLVLIVLAAYFVHELLLCVCLGTYNVTGYYGVGSTEVKFLIIFLNPLLIAIRPERLGVAPWIIGSMLFVTLIIQASKSQRKLWQIDLKNEGENLVEAVRQRCQKYPPKKKSA